jgi:hypothetical protein
MGRSYRNLRDKLPWSTMLSGVYISGVPGEQSKIFSRISNVGASKLLQNANIPRTSAERSKRYPERCEMISARLET